MDAETKSHSFSEGDVRFWIELGASIHLKAADFHGDPVELTAEEAKRIAMKLLEAADRLAQLDSGVP